MDSDTGTPSPEPEPAPAPTPASAPAPAPPPVKKAVTGREDCWSADATATLIEAWGERYLELNRGSLRQNHWQEVADAVNAEHCDGSPRSRRSDVQCKNRIDTLKKKYKIEKARVSDGPSAAASSPWPFFSRLDALLGPAYPSQSRRFTSPATPAGRSHRNPTPSSWGLSSPVPVGRRSFTQKRATTSPAPVPSGRTLSAFAAAVAAMEAKEDGDSERLRERSKRRAGGGGPGDAAAAVAAAIERLGEIYERVERAKQRQMVELETQRMQFAKELECQRMQLFMETQLQLNKIKRPKRSPSATTMADDHYE